MKTHKHNQKASVTPEVYASQDVPGNFGFIGCDSDQYETREAAEKAAKKASAPETRTINDNHDCQICGEHFSTCVCEAYEKARAQE